MNALIQQVRHRVTGISDLDLKLGHRTLPVPWTQRICHLPAPLQGHCGFFFLNSDASSPKLAPTTRYCYLRIVNDYPVCDSGEAMTFGLGSGIAGVAGVALSQLTNVNPNLGQSYIIDSFMVVVFGGVGNLWGSPRTIYR